MFSQHKGKALAAILSASMLASMALPGVALAATSQVNIEDYAASDAAAAEVRDLVIGDVAAPELGTSLDDQATVRTAEGESWDVPVLWIDSDLQLATEAVEGKTYLPALAFFVPGSYRVAAEGGSYQVSLSEELAKLFGSNEIVSIYDAQSGVTYILPAKLRDFFAPRRGFGAGERLALAEAMVSVEAPASAAGSEPTQGEATGVPAEDAEPEQDEAAGAPVEAPSLLDIYCSRTARDALTDEDLEWLLDLVLNKLQPEAVNLLLEKFPAFAEGARNGEIGTAIGLYIYYGSGDKDGDRAHEITAPNALAYVALDPVLVDGVYHFGYVIGVDAASLARKNDDDDPVKDPTTGKYVLVRDGKDIETMENTIVHELFHAFMDDYNRPGMTGSFSARDRVTAPDGNFKTAEQAQEYLNVGFPRWFIEGSATSVENGFAYRHEDFEKLSAGDLKKPNAFTIQSVVKAYINAGGSGKPEYYDLWYAGGYNSEGEPIDNGKSAYTMGYLATLYLSELQARKNGASSVVTQKDAAGRETYSINSETLRMGLNDILKRMHEGDTFDEVIYDISPAYVNGEKLYNTSMEFQKKFIKGPYYDDSEGFSVNGDAAEGGSVYFVVDLLNYLNDLSNEAGKKVNGTILDDFSRTDASMVNRFDDDTSDYFKIIETNTFVVSTVPDSEALKGGGRTKSGTPGHANTGPWQDGEYPTLWVVDGEAPSDEPGSGDAGDDDVFEEDLQQFLELVDYLNTLLEDDGAGDIGIYTKADGEQAVTAATSSGSSEGVTPAVPAATPVAAEAAPAAVAEAPAVAEAAPAASAVTGTTEAASVATGDVAPDQKASEADQKVDTAGAPNETATAADGEANGTTADAAGAPNETDSVADGGARGATNDAATISKEASAGEHDATDAAVPAADPTSAEPLAPASQPVTEDTAA